MGFDANGNYIRWEGPDTWQSDASAGTKILATRHDTHDKDLASALSDCLHRGGKGGALANISMGGHKITNLLNPTALTDAANWDSVTNIPGWTKSKYIDGTDLNGRLNFTGTSGVNGITWTYVDVSWVARHSKANETSNRLVMNNSKAPPTTSNSGDVFVIDDAGRMNNSGYLTNNLSYDGSTWRTISAGFGSMLDFRSGDFQLRSNDVATLTNPYVAVTPRTFFNVNNSGGSTLLSLYKSGSGKHIHIYGYSGATPTARWRMALGNGDAESGGASGRTGSNFTIMAYDNSGNNGVEALRIDRAAGKATLNGDIVVTGSLTTDSYLYSSDTSLILQPANNGTVLIRADGSDTAKQVIFYNNGDVSLYNGTAAAVGGLRAGAGLRFKQGTNGAYGNNWTNFWWSGSNFYAYDGTGQIHLSDIAMDYRMVTGAAPLPSVWDRVKALKPVSYTRQAFGAYEADSTERWGFLAHEVSDDLSPAATIGEKDGEHAQSLNLISVIAGLTRCLQEAMARIEQLEAAP